MKNLTKIFVAVVALFAYSCATDTTEELSVELGTVGQTKLALSLEESRTHITGKEGDSYSLYWSKGAQIAVNGVESEPLAEAAHGKTSATFTLRGELTYPRSIVYPAPAEGAVAAEGLQVVTIPATQEYVAGTFAEGAVPMYAYVAQEGDAISLQHIAGVLRISPMGGGEVLKEMTLTSASGKLAGNFDINCADGTLTPQADATNVITVDFGEGLTLGAEATPIFVAVPAGQYGVVDVVLTTDSEAMKISFNSEANPIKAGMIREFAPFTFKSNTTFEPEGELVITNEAELCQLAEWSEAGLLTKVTGVRVAANIDMSKVADWAPIKGFDNLTFDGGNFVIKGLKAPLFYMTTSTTIKNVVLEDVDILVESYFESVDTPGDFRVNAGSIAYYMYKGKLLNCSAKGKIEINTQFKNADTSSAADSAYAVNLGGLVGTLRTMDQVDNCTNRVNVTITSLFGAAAESKFYVQLGGVSGHYQGTAKATNCFNYGNIKFVPNQTTTTIRCGGVFGYGPATTLYDKCENYGDIDLNLTTTGGQYIGGVVGLPSATTEIKNCKNSGAINIGSAVSCTKLYLGAIASYNQKDTHISNCTATNNASGKGITVACDCENLYAGFMGKFPAKNNTLFTCSITDSTNSSDLHVTSDFSSSSSCYPTLGMTDTTKDAFSVQTIENFHTSGNILFEGDAKGYLYVASMMGYWRSKNNSAYKLVMKDCSNSGNITVKGKLRNRPAIGGIMAYNSGNYASLTNVHNTGNITVHNTLTETMASWISIGGITGYDGQEPPLTNVTNSGNITVTGNLAGVYEGANYPLRVGGIVAHPSSFAKIRAGVVNKGNITVGAEGVETKVHYLCVGGVFGDILSASTTMTDPINVGNIRVQNVTNASVADSYIGGIAGKTVAKITNAQCYCDIIAPGYTNVGWATGSARVKDTIIATNCKIGGNWYEIDEEDLTEKPYAIEEADYFNYIFGSRESTDWTGTENYDGCTWLSAAPTIQ